MPESLPQKPPKSPIISIRAPLAGSDYPIFDEGYREKLFQSALPLRGATESGCDYAAVNIFQSALPLRGATIKAVEIFLVSHYFNPRSPCGERHEFRIRCYLWHLISIRAPLAGSDDENAHRYEQRQGISIRAPLAGSDSDKE